MMLDRFADPVIAAEMRQVMGVRYVCLGDECDWAGNVALDNDGGCPRCGHAVLDRWEWHAREVQKLECR